MSNPRPSKKSFVGDDVSPLRKVITFARNPDVARMRELINKIQTKVLLYTRSKRKCFRKGLRQNGYGGKMV